jgi:dolichyl-phosphate-mannose--protein O-mannosyl transferase
MSFFAKFLELQSKMLSENNKLVAEHPYMSSPITWLVPTKGISYWHNQTTKGQIYLAGNIVGWVLGLASVAIYCGIGLADIVAQRRGFELIDERKLTVYLVRWRHMIAVTNLFENFQLFEDDSNTLEASLPCCMLFIIYHFM